jgi:hypothetical protein
LPGTRTARGKRADHQRARAALHRVPRPGGHLAARRGRNSDAQRFEVFREVVATMPRLRQRAAATGLDLVELD